MKPLRLELRSVLAQMVGPRLKRQVRHVVVQTNRQPTDRRLSRLERTRMGGTTPCVHRVAARHRAVSTCRLSVVEGDATLGANMLRHGPHSTVTTSGTRTDRSGLTTPCGRRATVHVHDTWNRLIGPFCTKCATTTIERLNAEHERQEEATRRVVERARHAP
jgi:hypothetical protein